VQPPAIMTPIIVRSARFIGAETQTARNLDARLGQLQYCIPMAAEYAAPNV
jgi:hypothetical protein